MGSNTSDTHRSAGSLVQYLGDSETGLVHRADADGCDAEAHELFLDLRTALVRGYRLCPQCAVEAAALPRRMPLVQSLVRA